MTLSLAGSLTATLSWVAGRVGLIALLVLAGCAHEVIEVDAEAPPIATPSVPLPLTVAVREGSFERSHLNPGGIMTHFADELRASRVFQGVMYPVPRGAEPRWEIQLAAVDGGSEPDSNFYKSAVATALFPLAFFIWLENDYTLELEALLLRDRELVASYSAAATIRHRYQLQANRAEMQAEGLETLARGVTREILAAIAADSARIEEWN